MLEVLPKYTITKSIKTQSLLYYFKKKKAYIGFKSNSKIQTKIKTDPIDQNMRTKFRGREGTGKQSIF